MNECAGVNPIPKTSVEEKKSGRAKNPSGLSNWEKPAPYNQLVVDVSESIPYLLSALIETCSGRNVTH